MHRIIIIIIFITIICISGCEDETIILPGDELRDQIRVTGTATIEKAPDIAIARIGVQTYNKEVEPAVADNNKKTDAVITALLGHGVEEKDIQTTSFNVYPERDYNKNPAEIIGYRVDNVVSVILRNLDSIGESLQAAIEAGANNINGLSFTLDDPEPLKQEARVKAIEDARQRAETMAEAAEIEVGKVISINELSSGYISPVGASYDAAVYKNEVPIEPGEVKLTVQIEVVFAIAE